MKMNAENGSPWRVPLSRLKNFVVKPQFATQDFWVLIKIWIHFRKRSPKPCFCKTANKKNGRPNQKLFRYLLLLGILSYWIKILAVSSRSYNISLPISLIYLFFTYAVGLDGIRWGNIFCNRVANAFEVIFRSVFSKDVSLQFLINLLSDLFFQWILSQLFFERYLVLL